MICSNEKRGAVVLIGWEYWLTAKSEGERDSLKSCEPKGILGFVRGKKDTSLES